MHSLLLFEGIYNPKDSQILWLEVHVLVVPQCDGHPGSV
jgi:hypothetical protein